MNLKLLKITLGLAACFAFSTAGHATVFSNGSFEDDSSGNRYTDWTLTRGPGTAATWGIAQTDEKIVFDDFKTDFSSGLSVQQKSIGLVPEGRTYTPTDGDFMSYFLLSDGAGSHSMVQQITIETGVTHIFWDMFYESLGAFDDSQQLSLTLRDVAVGGSILNTLFVTNPGDDLSVGASDNLVTFSADVSSLQGKTFFLHVNLAVFDFFLDAGFDNFRTNLEEPINEIPEPATLALFGIGLAGLGLARRRRKAA